jgi:hypothetical protein
MRISVSAVAFALFFMAVPASSQSVPVPSRDPQLTVTIRNNQSSFHIGEIIPLDLAFISSSPNTYQLDTATYDRSGRLGEDQFVVDPSNGSDDPLHLYFHSQKGFMMGGLRGFKSLSTTPSTVHADLNEWVRFKAPGQYRLTVLSSRVSKVGEFRNSTVTSNLLTLTILPATKEWQGATLKAAIQILDSTSPPVVPPSSPGDPYTQAVKTLRYLGTPEAAREMARRMTGTVSDWDFAAGLMGSPARGVGLEEMKKLLVDPNFPVSGRFLSTMSVLALPDGIVDNIPEEREKAETQFRQELMSALAQKRAAALAVSNNTIIATAGANSSLLSPGVKQTLTRQLVATFDGLSSQEQYILLEFRWSTLDHEQMLPLLKRVEQKESDDMQSKLASASALNRWYEMAPDEARPVVIHEILRPRPRFSARTLGILPDRELPEADEPLVEHLTPSSDFWASSNSASLIHRYATRAAEPKVVAFLDPVVGRLACAIQAPLLAYVLKDDPEAARPLLERAMEARGKEKGFTACNHSLLTDVGTLQSNNVLQEIAIRSLDDSDPQVVGDAASYLKQFGSASAESVLWARMVAWSEHWKGHEKDLQSIPGENMSAMYESAAGSHLVEALGAGHGWLPDEAKLTRLIDLSVTDTQKQQAGQLLKAWQARPRSITFMPVVGQVHIAQFQEASLESAKEKLLQFPPGSAFEWILFGQEGEQKAFEEMSQFAIEHGLKLAAKNVQK